VQKFTRLLTREIELAGTRLALTLSEQGVSVRIVGTRRPPWEMTWASVICHLTGKHPQSAEGPTPEELAAAVAMIKEGTAPPRPAAMTASAASESPEAPSQSEAADET
jgi:hypothetical protein